MSGYRFSVIVPMPQMSQDEILDATDDRERGQIRSKPAKSRRERLPNRVLSSPRLCPPTTCVTGPRR
jgi:hypothetical protein